MVNNIIKKSGLDIEVVESIRKVFSTYPQIDKVLIYGSRASGNFKSASDIDLSLLGKNIDSTLLNQIEFDLDDLLLPYKFDISIYDKITNLHFIKHIDIIGLQFYEKA